MATMRRHISRGPLLIEDVGVWTTVFNLTGAPDGFAGGNNNFTYVSYFDPLEFSGIGGTAMRFTLRGRQSAGEGTDINAMYAYPGKGTDIIDFGGTPTLVTAAANQGAGGAGTILIPNQANIVTDSIPIVLGSNGLVVAWQMNVAGADEMWRTTNALFLGASAEYISLAQNASLVDKTIGGGAGEFTLNGNSSTGLGRHIFFKIEILV